MRTTVGLPGEDLGAFGRVWRSEDVDSRSRAGRETVEEHTEAHARLESLGGEVTAVLAFDYTHHEAGGELHDVQHGSRGVRESQRGSRQPTFVQRR